MKRFRLLPLLLALTALLLYLLTLSCRFTADGLLFALDIDSGQPLAWLDPYHLLLHPLALSFVRLWRLLGYSGFSIVPLQVLNALGGALCVALFASIVQRATRSAWITAVCSAGLAVSGGMWLLSVEAEFVTLPLASHLFVLWLLLNAPPDLAERPLYGWILGFSLVLAALCYLTGLFLWPLAVIALHFRPDLPADSRRRLSLILSAIVLVVLGATFLFLAWLWPQAGRHSLASYLLGQGRYGRPTWTSLPHGLYAFLRTLVLYPGLAMNDSSRALLTSLSRSGRAAFAALYGLVLLIAAAPLWLAWRRRDSLWSADRFLRLVLLAWTLPFAAFAVIWLPGDFSFLLPVLVAWWLLVALTVPALSHGARWLTVLVILLLCFNGALSLLPRASSRANVRLALAHDLARLTSPGDLLLLAELDGMTWLHLTYFVQRPVWFAPLPFEADSESALEFLARGCASALSAGHPAWVVGLDFSSRGALEPLQSAVAAKRGSPCRTPNVVLKAAGQDVWPLCAP